MAQVFPRSVDVLLFDWNGVVLMVLEVNCIGVVVEHVRNSLTVELMVYDVVGTFGKFKAATRSKK